MIIDSFVQKGKGKETCDDAIFDGNRIVPCEELIRYESSKISWIAIADGVGGNAGGCDASHFLLDYIDRHYLYGFTRKEIISMLCDANETLIKKAYHNNGKERMATTFSGIFLSDDEINIAHVGNTRIYAKQGKYLKQLTSDHTTFQWHLLHGNYEAAETCNKSEITACFGGGDYNYLKLLSVETIKKEFFPHYLIMTTDGIHDYINLDYFEEIISKKQNPAEMISELLQIAFGNGSTDDCSIVVLQF